MKILAGLGNPGREYESTPHSIGFEVADAVAREMAATFRKAASFKGELADGRFANGKLLVVKPMTFMNLSGDSVAPVVKYHNATAADLVVVSDVVFVVCDTGRNTLVGHVKGLEEGMGMQTEVTAVPTTGEAFGTNRR